MRLFDVSAVVIRTAKPASMSVTWVVTQSALVVGCNLVASIQCKRGGDTQGEAYSDVSYLGSNLVSIVRCNLVIASIRCERGGYMQGEACFGVSYLAVT